MELNPVEDGPYSSGTYINIDLCIVLNKDTVNPSCDCHKNIETTTHFSLHCTSFLTPGY